MTMKKVNIFEAKARLSECIDAVHQGEEVVICRRNRPVAALRPIAPARTTPRAIGGSKGLRIPDTFFEPLPEDMVDLFYGRQPSRAPSQVAGGPASALRRSSSRARQKSAR